ncbi:MarR family winged helix-turn-helix transcriptional regulator [Leptospira wolffii]|uniref:MarR family winged helix-turn-helix transcriptional regulator n=1 Tax=Leptospira wolffii TaxID=409998 RepID=A0ABV5BR37_9LEPT|nr:MarR family transcriptional regulator [Leptospira wolffii]EPG64760.1 MarR family protein [Leptospira wolffii serovar Khorat str. Khorat-H2]TGL52405.1 MarR family transcriptional regulator [Leptospira wolffii]
MAKSASKKPTRTEIHESLSMTMREMSSISTLFSQAVADKVGINSTDMESGDFLNIYGPMTAGKLAELTGLTTGAVTGVIDRLEKARFARRVPDPDDRRKVLVEPLPDRILEILEYFQPMKDGVETVLSQYSVEDLVKFRDLCQKLIAVSRTGLGKLKQ